MCTTHKHLVNHLFSTFSLFITHVYSQFEFRQNIAPWISATHKEHCSNALTTSTSLPNKIDLVHISGID